MKQNTMFKIMGSLMILLTIMLVVNATTISNSLSTFTGNLDIGIKELYNISNVNTTNLYASVVNTTNLWVGLTKINASNLLPLACANNSVSKYDTATGVWLCQIDQNGLENITTLQFIGTTTKTLTIAENNQENKTATFTDLTNSSADMINTINNTAGVYNFNGLNISNNITFSINYTFYWNASIYEFVNTSGCKVVVVGTTRDSTCP